MDLHPSEPQSQPLAPPPARVSVWVRVRPFVAAFILVGVSFIGLHLWDQIGSLNEGAASNEVLLRPAGVEMRLATPSPNPPQARQSAAPAPVSATATRPPVSTLPALPGAPFVVSVMPTEGITPIIPEVVQPTTIDLILTIVEPTATRQPTTRPPQRPRPAPPTAAPVLPSRPVVMPTVRPPVTRPPVIVPPPPQPSPVPTAWRVPVQTPGNWTRPPALATPAP